MLSMLPLVCWSPFKPSFADTQEASEGKEAGGASSLQELTFPRAWPVTPGSDILGVHSPQEASGGSEQPWMGVREESLGANRGEVFAVLEASEEGTQAPSL